MSWVKRYNDDRSGPVSVSGVAFLEVSRCREPHRSAVYPFRCGQTITHGSFSALALVRDPVKPVVVPKTSGDQIDSDPQLMQHERQGELILIGPFQVLCPPNFICFSELRRQWFFPCNDAARVQARVRLNAAAAIAGDLLLDRQAAVFEHGGTGHRLL